MAISMRDLPTIEDAGRRGRRPQPASAIAEAYDNARRLAQDPAQAGSPQGLPHGFAQAIGRVLEARIQPSMGPVQALLSSQPSYTTYGNCGPYNYNGTCDEACFGFAPHHMDPFYCATCDEQRSDPKRNPAWNWHFVGTRGSIEYKDMEPNACAGRDAWKWSVGPCGSCSNSAVFRCHDGFKKYPNRDYWDPTICQGLISCNGSLTLCD